MSSKSTVWFVSRNLPTKKDPIKGIFVLDQATAVASFTKVEVLNLRTISLRGCRGPTAASPAINLQFLALPTWIGHELCEAARLISRMIFRGRPALIHGHWSSGLGGVAIAARIAKVPLVITEHGGPFPSRSTHVKRASEILNKADAVVSVSDWLSRELQDQGVTTRILVIPNVIGPEFQPTPMPEGEDFRIVVVARLDGFDKGVPEIISAVAHLNSEGMAISMKVVGDGIDRPRLETMVRDLASPVTFTGVLEREEIAALLSQSHALVSGTKIYETFGVAIAEALAAGRPVIATDVGGVAELVQSGNNGFLLTKTDPGQIADGIRAAALRNWDPFEISQSVARCRVKEVALSLRNLYASLTQQ